MEIEGIVQNVSHHKTELFLLSFLKTLRKCLSRASALSMPELHSLIPVYSVGTPILSVPFSFVYDQKHFGCHL